MASLAVFVKRMLPRRLASSISTGMPLPFCRDSNMVGKGEAAAPPGFVAEASRRQNEKPVVQKGRTEFLTELKA